MSDISNVDNATNPVAPSTPVAPPPGGEAPAATQATTTPVDTTVPGDTQEAPEPKRDRKVEKRISRLTQQREAAIREAGYWRGVAEAKASGTEPPTADGSPPQQQTRQAPAFDPGEVEHSKTVLERIREAGEDHEDFDDVMETLTSDDFKVSRTMRDFIGESDKPYDLAKWLTDNPKEAARIARLDPAVAVRALEKAEARLAPKPAPRTTNTPPPPPTVNGRGTPQFNPQTASMEDYAKHWAERRAARSR